MPVRFGSTPPPPIVYQLYLNFLSATVSYSLTIAIANWLAAGSLHGWLASTVTTTNY